MWALYRRLLSAYMHERSFACGSLHIRVRWRAGFYIAGEDGCVGNFIELLGDFLVWKTKAIQKDVEAILRSLHLFVVAGCRGKGRCLLVRCISSRAG